MPTKDEQTELMEVCTWQWVDNYCGTGVSGKMGTSKSNGNTIFLPAAGTSHYSRIYCHGGIGWQESESTSETGVTGYYWSSSLCETDCIRAYGFRVDSSSINNVVLPRANAGAYQSDVNIYSVRAVSK